MAQSKTTTGWAGWVYFAGAMLLVAGGLQILSGLVGIFHHSFYVVTQSGLTAFNYTTWGWIDLILGIFIMLTGLGVWVGSGIARFVAVVLAVLALIDSLAFLSAYPVWGVIGVIINGLIIYALTVHGSEVKAQ